MKILDIKVLAGANIYTYNQVIEMRIDLESINGIESRKIPGFNDNLLRLFPGLRNHYCSKGIPGGFVIRLEEGTYLGHIIEHLALELQVMLGHQVYFGKTRLEEESIYKIIFEYKTRQVGEFAARKAVEIVNSILEHREVNVETVIAKGEEIDRLYGLGPSTRALLRAAEERGIPWLGLGEGSSLYQLGYGIRQRRIEATIASTTSCIGVDLASDKIKTKELLLDSGLPVPRGYIVKTLSELKEIVLNLEMPLVVKPYNGNHGRGVSLNVYNWYDLKRAFFKARKLSDMVVIEEFIQGKDFRLLVVGNRVIAASERIPPHVVGDGRHTVRELVEIINSSAERGRGHERPLTRIKIDEIVSDYLKHQGYTPDSVLEEGQTVYLRINGNLSTGGTAVDITEQVHPYNCQLAVRAAGLVGLDIAGIDIITPDIRIPLESGKGAIIEVNAAPGIRMHHYPTKGKKRDVAREIINYLFPEDDGRIPIISITGTNGKTTTTRLVGHILSYKYNPVGMTTTGGIFINDQLIRPGDSTGPRSARTLLRDPSIEVAVLETARGGILREGLGYKKSDIGVITNISEDHLGINGVESLEDLADVKSLVIEMVRRDGYSVLNADDPTVIKTAENSSASIIYFSLESNNVVIKKHLSRGGNAVYLEGNRVIYQQGEERQTIIKDVTRIPITFDGLAKHNLENVLAAISISLGMGINKSIIERGLLDFGKRWDDNLGRLNLFQTTGLKIILDYGHNPAGFKEVLEFMGKLDGDRLVGVIGVPGDRKDELVIKAGKTAGRYLDKIYIKEDEDLRGRNPGEVAGLLERGLIEVNFQGEYEYISSEKEAVKKALADLVSGDVLVCFYEKEPEQLAQLIRQGIIEYETREPILKLAEKNLKISLK